MSRNFDFYEYAGIIIPGTVLVMALVWFFPEARALFSKEGVTLGELGLFIIIAYAAGQLVQAIGNGLEWALWKLCGGCQAAKCFAEST
jgi:ABC-type Fe3+ transport system permease subunit